MTYDKAVKDKKGKFQNPIPIVEPGLKDMPELIKRYWKSDSKLRKPAKPIPVKMPDVSILDARPSNDLVIYWMGHTSLLMEMGGRRYLVDPVLSERSSMVSWFGPKRMHPAPITIEALKNIDAVILSHDHYDHMDYKTMKHLIKSDTLFYTPLEVGKILVEWGARAKNVFELNWWDTIKDGPNTLAALPARHFSGRSLSNRFKTLWCSWAIINEKQRVYFGGDSGIMPQYKEIGDKYGPFDLAIMPIGAYDKAWPDIHVFPEEAVEAYLELNARKFLPVHWATFDLALHPWAEPMDRLVDSAKTHGVELITPMVGEKVVPEEYVSEVWWK